MSPFLSPSLCFLSLLKKGICSIMISSFFLVPGLVSLLVSLLVFSFFAQKKEFVHHDFLLLAGSGSGSGACLPSCLPSCFFLLCSKKRVCSIMISCFLLVPALDPGLVSLLVSILVFSVFAQKGNLFHHDFQFLPGSGACLPSCLASCLFFLCSKKESVPS